MMSLTDIPFEVFTGTILDYLDVPDILHLGQTCKLLQTIVTDQHFWRQRTLSTFRLPPQPIRQKGWDEMYKRLSTAKVFTWGSNQFGRLGHNYDATRNTFLSQKFPTPTEIESLRQETVVDLGCGGWSMWALTSAGRVYGWGKLEGDQFFGGTKGTPTLIAFPEEIDRIAVGRRNFLALSESGQIYTVEHDFQYINTAKIGSPDILEELPSKKNRVVHMAAGWRYAAAVFKGIGLMVWKSERTDEERQQVISSPLPPSSTERIYKARKVLRIEEIENPEAIKDLEIIGLMVGDGYLVYLTRSGTVHRVNVTDDIFTSTSPPESFCLEKFTTSPPLCYLSGSFDHFGLFNTTGSVLVGNHQTGSTTPPEIMPGLQEKDIIALSWGDWHALALCEDGSILSWGRELSANGCLGLGYKNWEEARQTGLVVNRGEVVTPEGETRRIPGFGGAEDKFAFCVAAAGWHSAALVADFKVKEVRKRDW